MLIVDCRESALLDALRTESCEVISKSLEIGDIIIEHENVSLVFERKTFPDLVASIKDGRYKEQKTRLLSHFAPKSITYILEGMPSLLNDNETYFGIRASAITSTAVYSMYRDGIHVYHSKNVLDTARWLALVAKKVTAHPEKFAACSVDSAYVHHVKAKSCKIDNIDPRTCYILQLCQIPHVSQKIASAIADKYGTLQMLLSALTCIDSNEARIAMLRAIPLVGPKKAEMIIKYLIQPT